ncbi:glutathione S-transferase [Aliivibrio fischeri]|uniref:glutathione S-transferase n=1 Tax=Aliivibrio fischeri TaxID=668 RepID=UPI0012D8E127|nr:glutathione S-transferase [Aliivibrio fischeri]MUK63023.1 glutathione S-transferase [Aliivibrio fischeri]MUK77830.1 glutathione S-transferase [Aliivibrio fischeri]MUL20360.1 glutathione S-transferase [Aliivibrio fischeri]MUL24135.1 glutathione S-transferase [Aliivibrio fischeri]
MTIPILYSLRQCPYAMRARLAILYAEQTVVLRDIDMNNKPKEMLSISPKGTVPVLHFEDTVIEESVDVMLWALTQSDPRNLLYHHDLLQLPLMLELIRRNDTEFVHVLQKYRAASRYHDDDEIEYRNQCVEWLSDIEERLSRHTFIMGESASIVDYALLPFIRQLSRVDKKWYNSAPLPHLRSWLIHHYDDPIFSKAMTIYPKWNGNTEAVIFG